VVRERSDPVAFEPEALRAWRSGACGARRPVQTAPNRGKAAAIGRLTPSDRAGEPVPDPHPGRQAVPDRSGCRLAHAVRMALVQPAIGAMARAGQRAAASGGAKWSEGMMLLDNEVAAIVALRRKGPTFADAGGACRSVIGCVSAGSGGDCDLPPQRRLPGFRLGF
jgi:hypothetical protein